MKTGYFVAYFLSAAILFLFTNVDLFRQGGSENRIRGRFEFFPTTYAMHEEWMRWLITIV